MRYSKKSKHSIGLFGNGIISRRSAAIASFWTGIEEIAFAEVVDGIRVALEHEVGKTDVVVDRDVSSWNISRGLERHED